MYKSEEVEKHLELLKRYIQSLEEPKKKNWQVWIFAFISIVFAIASLINIPIIVLR